MQVYFAADVHSKILTQWYGHFLFDVENIEPQVWGFQSSPALTTTVHHMEEGKTLYRLEARAYRHSQNSNVLLLLSLQRQGEEQKPVEERIAIIFGRAEDVDIIPQVLYEHSPKHLGDLVTPPRRPVTTGSVTSKSHITGVVQTVGAVWVEGSAHDRAWSTAHAHTTTTN